MILRVSMEGFTACRRQVTPTPHRYQTKMGTAPLLLQCYVLDEDRFDRNIAGAETGLVTGRLHGDLV